MRVLIVITAIAVSRSLLVQVRGDPFSCLDIARNFGSQHSPRALKAEAGARAAAADAAVSEAVRIAVQEEPKKPTPK